MPNVTCIHTYRAMFMLRLLTTTHTPFWLATAVNVAGSAILPVDSSQLAALERATRLLVLLARTHGELCCTYDYVFFTLTHMLEH